MKSTLATTHPELVNELVEPHLADQLSRGSTKKVAWRCHLGHLWAASPGSRTGMGSGCPVCAGKVVLPGFNDLASQNPKIAAQLVDQSLATKLAPRSGRKVEWRCTVDPRHVWTAPVNTRAGGHGCPVCNGKKVIAGVNDIGTTHPDVAVKLQNPSQARTVTAFSAKKLTWTCEAGHSWNAPVSRITGGAGCPFCSGLTASRGETDMATTHPELAAQLLDPEMGTKLKAQSNKKVAWVCEKGHVWEVSPNARAKGSGCPFCKNRRVIPGFNDLATTHPELAAQAISDVSAVTHGSHTMVTWTCEKGHVWELSANNRISKNLGCPTCSATSFVSKDEKTLSEMIKTLVPDEEVRTTVRNLLSRRELDIIIPKLNLAVEFNGNYFHTEYHRDAAYHRDKTIAASKIGLHLVHVWSDDWKHNPGLVIRALAHRLGATHRLAMLSGQFSELDLDPRCWEKLMARKLTPVVVTGQQARTFHDQNHLQGVVSATFHLGLVDTDSQIRAVISVRSPKAGARSRRSTGEWEIVRYSTLGTIAGGFTKLLACTKRHLTEHGHTLCRWISFSDNATSDGSLYRIAGFQTDGQVRHDYRYVSNLNGWRREVKENYQRKRFRNDPALLWDESWTEHQAALANGLYRVYDAGKTRWIKDL